MKGRGPRALALFLLHLFVSAGPAALVSAGTLPNTTQWSESDIGGAWDGAVNVQWGPDGRMYVVERAGKVWIVEPNGTRLSQPFIDISDEVGGWRDYGLLGFVLHPNFQSNGYVYLLYVVDHYALFNLGQPGYNAGTNEFLGFPTIGRITRYTADPAVGRTRVIPASRQVLVGESPSTGFPIMHESHGVGTLAWGMDGTLLAVSGDGACYNHTDQGSDSDTNYSRAQSDGIIASDQNIGALRSQYLGSLSGKMVRVDPDTGDGLPSNPFYDADNPRSSRSRVWALGLRNPYRFVRKPGTGSHNPADGSPGTFYVGDVGWNNAEDLHVVSQGGQNLGWPIFEGHVARYNGNVYNRQAKNPLYNGGSCTREYFYFSDLLKQESQNPVSFPNPCDANQQIPDSWTDGSGTTWRISKFEHSRPALSWRSTAQAPTFDAGGNATTCQVGATGCVAGPQFSGNASTGGVWYAGTDFPATFQSSYFHADFDGQWIKALKVDANDRVTQVTNFLSGEAIVFVGTHPTQGGLYYVAWGEGSSGRVRKITYTASGNQPPQAAAAPAVAFGPSPLAVNLSSAGSVDPEGQPLQYLWDFGDGTPSSTAAHPLHTFMAPSANPARFDVRLRVTDSASNVAEKFVLVSPNNHPPAVDIVSPPAGTLYPMDRDQPYTLAAEITDLEHPGGQLTCQWQLALHHNEHNHSEPVVNACSTTLVTSPAGCDGNTFFFRATLTVTDAMGLATTRSVDLYPDCPNAQPDLAVAVADSPEPAAAGAQVTYTLTVTNNGRGLAQGATLIDVLPAGFQLVSVDPSGCSVAGQTLTCALGDLSPASTRTFTVVATTTAGVFTNLATVSTPTPEANLTNNQGAAMTVVAPTASEPPVAENLSLVTSEDTPVAVTLAATDPEGQPLTFSLLTQPAKGVLTGTAPNLTYAPNLNANGPDTFTWLATDSGGRPSAAATVSLQINAINDPPVAGSQSVTAAQNVPTAVALTATDVDGEPLTFTVVTPPAHGILTGAAPALTYTPAAGYAGPDAFAFKANDGVVDSALATVSITVVSAPGLNWWDLRWSARRRLVMNAAARTTDLVDFPLLVRLDATRIDYALTQTGGRDLRFVDADGVTVLPHDVESWTTGGTSYVWVKVPRIDARSTTDHVWMYYGSPAAADGQNRAGLWGSSYRGVWHLQDATDASGNGRNGSDSGSTAATGRIGGARRFDGVSNHIAVPHAATLTFAATASYSLSAWVQLSALSSRWMGVVGKADAGGSGWYGVWLSDTRRWVAGGGTALNGGTAVTGWTHVAVVQDGPANARRLYVNGVQAASGTAAAGTGTAAFWIGGAPGDGEFLSGVVDEVRLAGLARSADWLAAEYQSESDTFLTFTSDPTAPNLAPTANPLAGNTAEDTPVALTLTGSDPEGQTLTFDVVTPPAHGTLAASGGSGPLPAQACDANGGGAPSGGCETKRTVMGSTPFAIPKPTGVAPGNTLVATCSSDASISAGALTGGAAWTSIGTEIAVGRGAGHPWGEIPWRIWYKVAGSAEPANYTLTTSSGASFGSCLILAFSGLAASSPYDGNLNETTGTSNTGTCGSITTAAASSLAYCVCGIFDDDTATSPASYTEGVDFEGSSGHWRVYTAAGPTGAQPVSFSASDPWACRHLSFRRDNTTLAAAGPSLVYTPAPNYNGADSFGFRVTDSAGAASAPATVTITVAPVNDPPAASPLTVTTPAQTAVAVALAGSDPDGDVLAFATLTAPAHGTLLGLEPSLTYTPAAGYTGPDIFTFRVSDPSGATATASVSITVTPVNAPPVALASTATTNEDTSVPVLLAGSDPDGGALIFTITTPPAHGSLSGTAPALTYTPAPNYFGPDTFAFSVRDALGATSAPASVSITVQPVNDPPLASFTATPSSGAPPLLVTANAAASVDPDGVIASYAWSFGDGATASGPTASHTYATAGTYTITLTVVDDAGAPAVATRSVAALSTPWWNASWTQRRKLTFDNAARASNLTNFPVLVSLDPGRIDYASTRTGGADLRFVDANGSTELAYEIEQWNAGGTSTVWVRVPQIDGASSADHVWMYYGNPSASSGQNRNAVWSASFNAVWHLTSTSTDSTGKNHSGTNLGASAVTGRLGGAQRFNGTSARIRVSNASDLRFTATASFTVTAWVQLDALPSAVKSVVTKSQNQAPRYGLGIDGSNRWVARGTTDVVGSTAAAQWAHLALVQDGAAGQRRLYVNGTLAATGAAQAANGSGQLYIGGSSSASDYLAGIIDEVRIAAAARSADWIAAEAASESGTLVTFSAQ